MIPVIVDGRENIDLLGFDFVSRVRVRDAMPRGYRDIAAQILVAHLDQCCTAYITRLILARFDSQQ